MASAGAFHLPFETLAAVWLALISARTVASDMNLSSRSRFLTDGSTECHCSGLIYITLLQQGLWTYIELVSCEGSFQDSSLYTDCVKIIFIATKNYSLYITWVTSSPVNQRNWYSLYSCIDHNMTLLSHWRIQCIAPIWRVTYTETVTQAWVKAQK